MAPLEKGKGKLKSSIRDGTLVESCYVQVNWPVVSSWEDSEWGFLEPDRRSCREGALRKVPGCVFRRGLGKENNRKR